MSVCKQLSTPRPSKVYLSTCIHIYVNHSTSTPVCNKRCPAGCPLIRFCLSGFPHVKVRSSGQLRFAEFAFTGKAEKSTFSGNACRRFIFTRVLVPREKARLLRPLLLAQCVKDRGHSLKIACSSKSQ
ncbi:hypothetical protein TGARI_371880 [Toxoplasma gondii ARI]|uniref:Uncharacterized protein n=1 Tax=Toxoplasma gondii ARI TaxID=1074872 RepID=A0A139XKR5_TOXGO|nr:hypothetical protein TGARI_371880 [Toxoplasma gondii ARI]